MTASEQVAARRFDKAEWPEGPWKSEPDRVDFVHAGYACLILRGPHGQLCGYVGVDESHPWFGKYYDDCDVSVHGGLTYANHCHGEICHVPAPAMPDRVWWLGFDCAHAGDLVPGMLAFELSSTPELRRFAQQHLVEDVYRDLAYVRRETESLAEQLRALVTPAVAALSRS